MGNPFGEGDGAGTNPLGGLAGVVGRAVAGLFGGGSGSGGRSTPSGGKDNDEIYTPGSGAGGGKSGDNPGDPDVQRELAEIQALIAAHMETMKGAAATNAGAGANSGAKTTFDIEELERQLKAVVDGAGTNSTSAKTAVDTAIESIRNAEKKLNDPNVSAADKAAAVEFIDNQLAAVKTSIEQSNADAKTKAKQLDALEQAYKALYGADGKSLPPGFKAKDDDGTGEDEGDGKGGDGKGGDGTGSGSGDTGAGDTGAGDTGAGDAGAGDTGAGDTVTPITGTTDPSAVSPTTTTPTTTPTTTTPTTTPTTFDPSSALSGLSSLGTVPASLGSGLSGLSGLGNVGSNSGLGEALREAITGDKGGDGKGSDDASLPDDGKGSDDKGSDGKGSDGKGSDGKGTDDAALPDDGVGSDGKGGDDKGSDGKGSDDKGDDKPAEDKPAGATPAATPAATGNVVSLPDGSSVTAADAKTAQIGRDIVTKHVGVAEAFQNAQVQIPPVGSVVTSPIDRSEVRFGDVAVTTSGYVFAVGPDKVWVDGQVQSISDATVKPGEFLGWARPTAPTAADAPAEAVAPVASAPGADASSTSAGGAGAGGAAPGAQASVAGTQLPS